jgi:uncharacterized protein
MPVLSPFAKKALIATALAAATLLTLNPARAHQGGYLHPSFDCVEARLAAERAICADRHLRAADVRTASIYQAAVQRAGRVSDEAAVDLIRQTQRGFLARRNACGRDQGCIEDAYRVIVRQLQDFMRQLD